VAFLVRQRKKASNRIRANDQRAGVHLNRKWDSLLWHANFKSIDCLGTNNRSEAVKDLNNSITVAKQLAGKSWLHFRTRRTTASVVLSIKGEIMKKWIFSAVVIGCLLVLMITVPAQAQMPGTTMRVAIPFDFIVKGKTLSAGYYEIERINDSPEGLIIRAINNKHDHVMFETETTEAKTIPNESEVIFHRYGDSYFLSEIFTAGERMGRELAASRAERNLRSEVASNRAEPETVALAAN